MEFLELHVRGLYQLLGHRGYYSQVFCHNKDNFVSRELVKSEEELVKWAKQFNGKGNCYIGRNPRDNKGEVAKITCVSFDIDPVREKDTASSDAQHALSLALARNILSANAGGYLASSGNGALLIYRCPKDINYDYNTFANGFKAVEEEVRKQFETAEVRIDSTHDNKRLVRLLGTINVKKGNPSFRVSRFLIPPAVPYKFNQGLFGRIELHSNQYPTAVALPSTFKSRSEADFALAVHYRRCGLSEADTLQALKRHSFGRNDREDDHRRIVQKVFSGASTHDEPIPSVTVHSPKTAREDYFSTLFSGKHAGTPELPTGFGSIDRLTWGLRRKSIFTVAARPGIGKTSLALSITSGLLHQGKRVLMLSTEMSYEEIFHRLLSIRSGIPVFDFISNALDGEKRKRLEKEYEVFESGNFFVCDTSEPDTRTIEQAVSKTQPDVFILDYIQHATDGGNGDYHAISRLMRFLKDVAVRNNLAVLLVSQLSRAAEIGYDSKGRLLENSRPLLRHLKGSGGLEEESHVVILLSHLVRDDQSPTLPVIADLAKNKNGPKGIVELSFDRVHCRFIGEASEK